MADVGLWYGTALGPRHMRHGSASMTGRDMNGMLAGPAE